MHWRAVSKAGFYAWAALYALLLLQAALTDWTTPFSSLLDILNGPRACNTFVTSAMLVE